MILKLGGGSGGTIEISDAPKITYSGKWLHWHLEFYDGVLYWEAWFLSSGTLTVEDGYAYTADAWGIGGGGSGYWSYSGSRGSGCAGYPNMIAGTTISGAMAVTIGAGATAATYADVNVGGSTKLGNLLTCTGGDYSGSGTYKRYRFGADDKAHEAAGSTAWDDMNGWLYLASNKSVGNNESADTGFGIGAGTSTYGLAKAGALVVRIPA